MRPVVAIVGRPNVGKSTLLNRLTGRRVALVADTPGVTRDRLFAETTMSGRGVILVDTGGFDPTPEDDICKAVLQQAELAIEEADLVLFVCDAKDGLHPLDQTMANLLKKSQKPILCLINKSDPGAHFREEWEFHRLGLDFLPVSALHGTGLNELADRVAAALPTFAEQEQLPHVRLRICLLGRPNVGKSSLANRLIGKDRQMVSPQPGTTRDAVDMLLQYHGSRALLVDTPGVRRKRSIDQQLERMSVMAAIRSLERADVAMVVLDGTEPFAVQDARLLSMVHDRGRGLVVVINKSDLWEEDQPKRVLQDLERRMRFVSYAPVLCVSARTGKGVHRILRKADQVHSSTQQRISTSELNQFVASVTAQLQPPMIRGRRAKIYYITQASICPPTFVVWVNDSSRVPKNYQRFLENRLRKRFKSKFEGAPLRWIFKGKKR